MKLLAIHNFYRQPGGEDVVFEAETRLLSRHGHDVVALTASNAFINDDSPSRSIKLAAHTVWSRTWYEKVADAIRRHGPDVVHFHNTFPLISPAAYYACRDLEIPVVQTLHNYRLSCPAATFFRDGTICEECLDNGPWQGVKHACYRGSRSASAAVAAMISFHRWYGTWANLVDCYIALSEFSRAKFVEAGLPAAKIVVKPNFVLPDPGPGYGPRNNVVFLGRLSEEKGLRTLLQAWPKVNSTYTLRVIGDGPLKQEIGAEVERLNLTNIRIVGRLPRNESMQALQETTLVVAPSACYENFPMAIAEAYACGTPVIASRLGAMQEIVDDGRTGLHFTAGNAEDLANKVTWAMTHPDEMREMGRNARREYEAKYTAERNYKMLVDIYERVIGETQTPSTLRDTEALVVTN